MFVLQPIRRISIAAATTAIVLLFAGDVLGAESAAGMIQLTLKGEHLEGQPLGWDDETVHLLGRDGRLWTFKPTEASDFRATSSAFRCYSPSEFRAALLRELGEQYEISGTGHYLVAHARGQRDKWAERFENLYRSFVHYFSIRGLQPQPPPFPLVAVVCTSREDFHSRAAAQGTPAPRGTLGYYDLMSNRILLYDMGASEQSWQENAAVILHEATHQTAFNTGVQNRYCQPPRWAAEGLAMMFESPGIYDPHQFTRPQDRVNRDRLASFRRAVEPHHRPEVLQSIVRDDELFSKDPNAAYAEAWAFSYFLSESEPRKYADYLKRCNAKRPFQEYPAKERLADFTAIFGSDWRMLEARFLRFMAGVK